MKNEEYKDSTHHGSHSRSNSKEAKNIGPCKGMGKSSSGMIAHSNRLAGYDIKSHNATTIISDIRGAAED